MTYDKYIKVPLSVFEASWLCQKLLRYSGEMHEKDRLKAIRLRNRILKFIALELKHEGKKIKATSQTEVTKVFTEESQDRTANQTSDQESC